MEIKKRLIHNHDVDVFNIKADVELYQRIVDDMVANAGKFAPRSVWQKLEDAGDYSTYESGASRYIEEVLTTEEMVETAQSVINKYPYLSDLLDSWVGPRGKREEFDPNLVRKFEEYSGLFTYDFFSAYQEANIYKTCVDLSTITEVGIINELLASRGKASVVEIGGGYGRLCEGVMNAFGRQVYYLISDSVPISLMYCYLYLKNTLPEMRVGLYYFDQNPDIDEYDCFIVPTWRMEEFCKQSNVRFDLSVNIQSMQEMSQWHVDYYLNFFDRYLVQNGYIYLNNNEEYIFLGDWNYPKNWAMVTRHETPWSWSDNCPTTIFQRKDDDRSAWNSLVEYEHEANIGTRKNVNQQRKQAQALRDQITKSNQKVDSLQSDLLERQGAIEELKDRLVTREREIKGLDDIVAEKQRRLSTLEKSLQVKTTQVLQLEGLFQEKTAKILQLEGSLQEKDAQVQRLEDALQEKNVQVHQLEDALQEKNVQVHQLEGALQEKERYIERIVSSTSWKITAPLRKVMDWIRSIRK